MPEFTLAMRDDGGSSDEVTIEAEDLAGARSDVRGEAEDWVSDGEWGDEGAAVRVHWTLRDEDGDEVDEGSLIVEVEPDHDALIRAAGGDPDCEHDWTREGEGGCDENPGVWSVGGTAMVFASHCRTCGLRKRERITGSQRNPNEHDTVTYEQPDSWCPDCEREDCVCEPADVDVEAEG